MIKVDVGQQGAFLVLLDGQFQLLGDDVQALHLLFNFFKIKKMGKIVVNGFS